MPDRPSPQQIGRRRCMARRRGAVRESWSVLAGVYGIGRLRSNPADAGLPAGGQYRAAASRRWSMAKSRRWRVAQTPFQVPDLAFKDARATTGRWPTGAAAPCSSICGRPGACRAAREMPALDALQAKLGGPDFEVVAVNIDTRDPQKPLAFLKDVGVSHLAYYADPSAKVFQDLKTAGKAFGMPTTMLVDRSGCEIGTMAGPAEWASDDGVKLVGSAIRPR